MPSAAGKPAMRLSQAKSSIMMTSDPGFKVRTLERIPTVIVIISSARASTPGYTWWLLHNFAACARAARSYSSRVIPGTNPV